MKLTIGLAIVSFALACSALKVNEAFLDEKEIERFRAYLPKIDKQPPQGIVRRHGVASLPSSIARRMLSSACTDTDNVCSNKDVDFDLEVRTSLIDRSTQEHIDRYSNGEEVHEDVGFVFLNTNHDAHFQHGKDAVVPIKAGNLVTFKGDVSHNTIVNSGQVHLLGPFDMVNFLGVGDSAGGDCCGMQVLLETPQCCVTGCDYQQCLDTFLEACLAACEKECPDGNKTTSECFSSANIVEVQGKGLVAIDSLKIGDFVRAAKGKFSRVYSFLHFNNDVEAQFLQIHADGMGTPLEISPDHMIFVKNTPVRASKVKVGDLLGDKKVSEIKSVKRRGVYAPVTESGDIVVNGVLASSYAAVRSFTPVNPHSEAHAFFAVRRLVCAFNFSICKSETYNDEGFPHWLSPMVHFALSTKRNPFAQFCSSVFGIPLIATVYSLEQIVLSPFLILFLVVVGLFAFTKTKMPSKSKVQ